jgi:hypothetical protein
VTATSKNKTHAIAVIKVLITILENLSTHSSNIFPTIIDICVTQLKNLGKNCRNLKSMLLQTLCLALWFNSGLTFSKLSTDADLNLVFSSLAMLITRVKHGFELKRFILGLTIVLNQDPQGLPATLRDRLPLVFKWLSQMVYSMQEVRMKEVREKERDNQNMEEELMGEEDEDGGDSSSYEDEESESEFQEINQRIQELRRRERGQDVEGQDNENDEYQFNQDNDSDYEYIGGDSALCDSTMEAYDELMIVQSTFTELSQQQPDYF